MYIVRDRQTTSDLIKCSFFTGGDYQYSDTVRDINIAASGKKNPEQLNELQTELQDLIDNLDVRLPVSGHAMRNTADYGLPFKINGKTVINREFDEEGYAEKVLDILRDVATSQYCLRK